MTPKKLALLCIVLLLVGGMAAGGFLWRERSKQIEQARQSFVPRYEKAMMATFRAHYFMFDELPSGSEDVAYLGELREPWVIDGLIDSNFNKPSLAEGLLRFENKMFEQTLALAKDHVPKWQDEVTRARKPLIALDGNLSAQLDLFADPSFDNQAGHYLLVELQEQRGVDEDVLLDFVKAFVNVRSTPAHVEIMKKIAKRFEDDAALSAEVLARSDADVASAIEEYQRAKKAVLEQADVSE